MTALLEVAGLDKRFGGLPAIQDLSLTVHEGEILALVGPNGAGKTTLLRTVVGLSAPTAGTIRFRGSDITRLPAHRVRQTGIAMVLQTPRMFGGMTVRENVALGALFGSVDGPVTEPVALDQADRALDFVDLGARRDDEVASLNLHEQRFCELARALAGQPRLLLLDEVMAGLNDVELQASVDIVRTARDHLGLTVIWVEHVMKAVLSLAERVAVLNFGQIIVDGTPEQAMQHPEVVTAYLGTKAAEQSSGVGSGSAQGPSSAQGSGQSSGVG